jgi:hypothetical protein
MTTRTESDAFSPFLRRFLLSLCVSSCYNPNEIQIQAAARFLSLYQEPRQRAFS